MKLANIAQYSLASFDSPEEFFSSQNQLAADFIEIKSDQTILDLGYESAWGTKAISWEKEIRGEFIESIPVSHRKKVRKAIRACEKNNIRAEIYPEIPRDIYIRWLSEIYTPFMKQKGKNTYIGENWLEESGKIHSAVFIFMDKKLIGGSFFRQRLNGNVSFSYKAILHNLSVDPNPLLEKTAYEIAQRQDATLLRKGIDFNLYGVDLSIGLMEYKLKYGFYPVNYLTTAGQNPSYYRHLIIPQSSKFKGRLVTFVSDGIETYIPKLKELIH